MIADNFEEQFGNNIEEIKNAYIDVNKLSAGINSEVAKFVANSNECDEYKFLIIGRALNLAIYNMIVIKFNRGIELNLPSL